MINIKTIWENQIATPTNIVRTKIEDIHNVECFAATNQLRNQIFFILSLKTNIQIPDLKNYKFQGVEFFAIEINNRIELNIYLMNNELLDIFSLFIDDLLNGIDEQTNEFECVKHTLNKASKWKLLFDRLGNQGLSTEKQKGLLGELLFLDELLTSKETYSSAIESWISMDLEFNSKDFIVQTTAIEVKFTTSNHPRIKISSKAQLEMDGFSNLFLVLYSAQTSMENGISINSLVNDIRNKLRTQNEKENFNRKLNFIGYFDTDRELYNQSYTIKKKYIFLVENNFPKLISDNIPAGIYDLQYSIEISAIQEFKSSFESLFLMLSNEKSI
jgi:hypothetical protein